MKRSDIYICGFMYLFSLFFLALTQEFPLEVRHYPHFVIGLLLLLTTIRASHMVRDYRRTHSIVNDMPELFSGFLPKQFWVTFGAFILFFLLMYFLGFYIAALIYLLITLRYFKIRPLYIGMVLIFMAVLVYATFDTFLNVPLPMGVLLEDFL